ncbi:MAG TPA: FtsX-like permease family protein, partial [Longimicrobiaceae bacterium]|nr:FtsX-like permease family protein [Longimicrobiaceae bacterium]
VLLIAVANVASLSLVRSMRRWREISLRSVLGASRGRLVRLMVTESVALAMLGAVLGIAVGWAGLRLLQRFAAGIPRLYAARLDGRAVAVALALALAAGIVIGIVPALRLMAGDAGASGGGTRTVGDGRLTRRVRSAFVAAEFALALPVLAAGALLLNSVMRLQRVDPGFDPRGVQVMTIALPSRPYADDSVATAGFWRRVIAGVEQVPGVASAGFATAMPPNDNGNSINNFDLVDRPVGPDETQPTAPWPVVSADFFAALRLPLLEGRLFTPTDTGVVPVVVVTKAWARRWYPGRSPVGRELVSGGCSECPHTVVVGVVGDATVDGLGTPGEAVFSPLTEGWPTQLHLFVRASGSAAATERLVRAVVQSAEPSAAMGPMDAMEARVYDSVAQPRHWALILAAFAAAALAMAAVGIFGLLSFAVALRRGEIGVRMALGAPARRVVHSILADGMRSALAGTGIGLVLALAAARWLRASLFEVSAFDPPTLLAVTAGLLAVALVAAWLPARRAAAIDPLEAIRAE